MARDLNLILTNASTYIEGNLTSYLEFLFGFKGLKVEEKKEVFCKGMKDLIEALNSRDCEA